MNSDSVSIRGGSGHPATKGGGGPTPGSVREAKQERSRRTQQRIEEAALALLDEQSFDTITMQQIATRAGCSVGTLYERFRNKEALLEHLLAGYYRQWDEDALFQQRMDEHPDPTIEESIDFTIAYLVTTLRRRRGLMRALVIANRDEHSVPQDIRERAVATLQRVHRLYASQRDRIRHSDPDLAIRVMHYTITQAIFERFLFSGTTHAVALAATEDELIDELRRMALRYLLGDDKPRSNNEGEQS